MWHLMHRITQNFWFLNNDFIGDGHSITFNLTDVGNNVLRCEMLDNYGCESTTSQVIVGLMNVGSTHYSDFEFSIFPNPTSEQLVISGLPKSSKSNLVEVIDAVGKRLFTTENSGELKEIQLNVKSLNPGVYFIHIRNGASIGVKRFVKI